jgi:hypothetical protein
MGSGRRPQPVKAFCGLLSGDVDLLRRARQLLVRRFGPVDLESATWPFSFTDYYAGEMGSEIQRCFVSFEKLIDPQRLVDLKVEANALEQEMARECLTEPARPVNIDPGYIDLSKLVLATTKDRSHRIYLHSGIYAEVTLQFAGGGWQPGAWTYADYLQPEYHAFFTQVRTRLQEQRKQAEAAAFESPIRGASETHA